MLRPSLPPVVVCLAFVVLASGCASPDPAPPSARNHPQPVVGGQPASPDEYPSTVAVTDPSGDPFCSGTLVAPDVVVTAAHCIDSGGPSDVRVVYGHAVPAKAPASERRTVAEVRPHPGYAPNAPTDAHGLGPVNDIGVLILDEPIPGAVVTAVLPDSEVDSVLTANRPLHVVGFGINDTVSQASGVLYKGITPHVRHTEAELLAGRPGEADACFGDSGGPAYVVHDGTLWLVGATSRVWDHASQPCGQATVYTMVPHHVQWISSVAGVLDGGVLGGWDAEPASDAGLLQGDPACVPLDNACHPVTNEGCDTAAGEACRFEPMTASVGCAPGPNEALPGAMCDQTSRFCMPGFFCGASIRCEKLCCNDTDCPAGVTCRPLISLLGNIGTCGPVKMEVDAGEPDAGHDAAAEAAVDGSPPDATVDVHADATPEDGGVDAPDDAHADATDGDAEPGVPDAIDPTGGCSCMTRPPRSKGSWFVLAMVMAAIAFGRISRRRIRTTRKAGGPGRDSA